MIRLEASDIKDIGLLKHYRIIRRWACRNNDLTDSDLELLIYFDCLEFFSKHDYEIGTYAYSWDNKRWNKLLKEGWIVVWRNRNHTTQKYNIYKVSFKCKQLISRMYRIMLGKEDIPTSYRNTMTTSKRYSDIVGLTAIEHVNNDKTRNNNNF
jgi:hypothetical protein